MAPFSEKVDNRDLFMKSRIFYASVNFRMGFNGFAKNSVFFMVRIFMFPWADRNGLNSSLLNLQFVPT